MEIDPRESILDSVLTRVVKSAKDVNDVPPVHVTLNTDNFELISVKQIDPLNDQVAEITLKVVARLSDDDSVVQWIYDDLHDSEPTA